MIVEDTCSQGWGCITEEKVANGRKNEKKVEAVVKIEGDDAAGRGELNVW